MRGIENNLNREKILAINEQIADIAFSVDYDDPVSRQKASEKVRQLTDEREKLYWKGNELRHVGEIAKEFIVPYELICFRKKLGRKLTIREHQRLVSLIDTYSVVLINEALERAVNSNRFSFEFVEAVLQEWDKRGLKTREDITDFESNLRSRATNILERGNMF